MSSAGIISRILGFFYKIFLSRTIGATGLGLYQLIFPIFSLCLSISTSGIQTAISRFVAIEISEKSARKYLYGGLFISTLLCTLFTICIYIFAPWISNTILKEARTEELLRIMSFAFIPAAIHSCFNGYFYGKKNSVIPSICQILEQVARVGGIFLIYTILSNQTIPLLAIHAVWGLVISECMGLLVCLTGFLGQNTTIENIKNTANYDIQPSVQNIYASKETINSSENTFYTLQKNKHEKNEHQKHNYQKHKHQKQTFSEGHKYIYHKNKQQKQTLSNKFSNNIENAKIPIPQKTDSSLPIKSLLTMAIPLSMNHVLMSLSHSLENMLIPQQLMAFGFTSEEALSHFGILSGMALSLVFFPAVITNSLSVLLLPRISEVKANNDKTAVMDTIKGAAACGIVFGSLCTFFFLFSADWIGTYIFENQMAGFYVQILSILCPFMYTSSLLSSIVNGLGYAHLTLLCNSSGCLLRIVAIWFFMPTYGMYAYIFALIAAALLTMIELAYVVTHIVRSQI